MRTEKVKTKIYFPYKNIILIGDCHCDCTKLLSNKKLSSILDKKEYYNTLVVQLGDFGVLWNDPITQKEKHHLKWICEKKFDVLVIPGNHENYTLIENLPTINLNGLDVYVYNCENCGGSKYKSIYFAKPGVIEIQDKKILCVRGAESIDKDIRTPNKTWWEREKLSYEEIENIMDISQTQNIHYIFSHTCPKSVLDKFVYPVKNCQVSQVLDSVNHFLSERDQQPLWFFGHLHLDKIYKNFTCVYEDVHRLDFQ